VLLVDCLVNTLLLVKRRNGRPETTAIILIWQVVVFYVNADKILAMNFTEP